MGRFSGGMLTMLMPSNRIWPESGRSNPAIMRNSVVLPQPEGPSRVKNSPFSIVMLTLFTAVKSPKRRVTSRISSNAIASLFRKLEFYQNSSMNLQDKSMRRHYYHTCQSSNAVNRIERTTNKRLCRFSSFSNSDILFSSP